MASLQRLFTRIIIFSVIITISVILLDRIFIIQSTPYMYLGGMLNDKHKIARQTKSPKALLVGGSSISFGINSDTLEKYLGIPVVNMSFTAPLGTNFLMNDALKEVKNGDRLFICTEYDIAREGSTDILYSAADYYKDGALYIKRDSSGIKYIGDVIKHKLTNVRRLFWSTLSKDKTATARIDDTSSVYFRNAFSPKGDIVSHVNNTPQAVSYLLFPKEKINYSGQIEDINYLITQAQKKGVQVYFIFPPLARSTYVYGREAVRSVEAQLKKELRCTILGSAEDFVQSDSSFFDSFYHLRPAARDENTNKIITLYNQNKRNDTRPVQ